MLPVTVEYVPGGQRLQAPVAVAPASDSEAVQRETKHQHQRRFSDVSTATENISVHMLIPRLQLKYTRNADLIQSRTTLPRTGDRRQK